MNSANAFNSSFDYQEYLDGHYFHKVSDHRRKGSEREHSWEELDRILALPSPHKEQQFIVWSLS